VVESVCGEGKTESRSRGDLSKNLRLEKFTRSDRTSIARKKSGKEKKSHKSNKTGDFCMRSG